MSAEGISSNVRRIAILVTSLDASAGRQLLMAMPTELARQVRRAMTQLGHVDPDEQRQILAEFRMQAMNSGAVSGGGSSVAHAEKTSAHALRTGAPTEFGGGEPGLAPAGLGGHRHGEGNAAHALRTGMATEVAGEEPGLAPFGLGGGRYGERNLATALPAQLDADTLSVLLRGERATVVAVVLSQLEPQSGADLLGKLPKPLQREAILSLSRIGQIDPDAMKAIHEHLASRIADYHHRQADENQSTGRIQELLAAAAPDLRSDWQSTLYHAEPHMAARMGIAPPAAAPSSTKATSNPKTSAAGSTLSNVAPPAIQQAVPPARGVSMLDLLANNVVTTADLRVAKTFATPTSESKPKSSAHHQERIDNTSIPPVATTSVQQHRSHDSTTDDLENERARILPFPGSSSPASSNPASSNPASVGRSIRFEEILDLPAEVIGEILAAADTEVILYALAGASPAFMKRFMSMLDRADGRALQARLKQLRAINLQDVDAAQRRLCELASSRRLASAA